MLHGFILVVHVALALLIIGLVLLQRGKGAEAGAGFGSGASGTVFGARGTTTLFSRLTAVFAALFFTTSLLLTYLGFATGFAGLVGSFIGAALGGFGLDIGRLWIPIGGAAMLLAWWLAHRDMRLAGRLMLGLEAAAVLAITALSLSILRQVHPSFEESMKSFRVTPTLAIYLGNAESSSAERSGVSLRPK